MDVETSHFFAVSDAADGLVACLDFASDLYAGSPDFVELLEIRMVLVENTPKLQINQCSLFEFLHNLILFSFDLQLADEIQKLFIWLLAHLLVDLVFEKIIPVVFIVGELLILYHEEVLEGKLLLFLFVKEGSILKLKFGTDGSESIAITVDLFDDVLAPKQLLILLTQLTTFEQLLFVI